MVRVTVSPEGAEEAPSDAWLETLLEVALEGEAGSVDLLLFSSSHQHDDQYNDQGGDS